MNIEVLPFNGPDNWQWVCERVPMKRVSDTCGWVAFDHEKEELVGAVIFDNFLNSSVQATIILESPMVLRSNLLEKSFKSIFDNSNRYLMYVMIAENNMPSLNLSKKLGFVEVLTIPDGYQNGVDFIVKQLHRDDCQFYKKLNEVA